MKLYVPTDKKFLADAVRERLAEILPGSDRQNFVIFWDAHWRARAISTTTSGVFFSVPNLDDLHHLHTIVVTL